MTQTVKLFQLRGPFVQYRHSLSIRALLAGIAFTSALIAGLSLPAQAQAFSVLYTFQSVGPAVPYSGVTVDSAGSLYGTTAYSNAATGSVYKLSHKNSGWVFSLLVPFTKSSGNTPLAPPVFGPDGSLYGTTYFGGFGCDLGCGNVYNLRPTSVVCKAAPCYWMLSTVYDFGTPDPGDGAFPGFGNPLFDEAGNIYGTNISNDIGSDPLGGTVFELSRSNGRWTETILHQFGNGADGSAPTSGLIRDRDGNLYGTTSAGGGSDCNDGAGCGTVYELSPSGSGWTERILYAFQGQNDGDIPVGGLIMDAAGNLYGTTSLDGANGGGTIYQLTSANGTWSLTTLYSFTRTGQPAPFCSGQQGSLLLDHAGNLYGTTCSNGAFGYGAVFKLAKSNGNWIYSSLHDFTNGNDGANPVGNPAFDTSGNIYGTASRAGAQLEGTVWEVTP